NYMPINSGYPGSAPGAYTVRTGETLRSIATSLWGDAALWWVLADANGLSGDDALIAGTVLRVPNKVTNVHNTSETYRPYDPGKALGNTSPTLPEPPPPPGRGGCGGLGAVLSVVVAVAVTAWTGGAASALLGSKMLGWAAAGALGSVAGQATAMATGVQDNFSWTGVALGAVGAGVTAGLTQAGSLSAALAKLGDTGSQIALGGIRSVVTQGIGVTTGLQSSFDWKGVAISAIAQGVSYLASNAIGEAQYGERDWALLNNGVGPELRNAFFARDGIETAIRSVGAGLAAGTSSALMRGGSLGSQLGAVTLDAVGASIGNAVAGQLASADLAGALKNVSASDLRTMQRLGERAGISSWEDPAKLQILAKASWAQGAQGHWYSPEERAGITASYLGLFSGMSEDRVNETIRLFRAEGLFSDLTTRTVPRNVVASTQGPDTTQEFSSIPTFYLPETSVVGQIPKPFLLARALDDMTVGAGRVVEQLGQAIESNPIAKAGLMALDVAAGPAAFAVRQAVSMTELGRIIERGQEQALGYLVGRFDLAGYDGAESGSGAIGAMALGSALLGGATKAVGDLARLTRGNGVSRLPNAVAETTAVNGGGTTGRQVLYHYTNEAGAAGIVDSASLNPSLWRVGTKDVRYGNGQYVSDIVPGTRSPSELSRDFLGIPFQGSRFTHYVEIDATGLGAVQGRAGVYVIPNETPLDLTGRLISSGRVPRK
ncbi:MAG: LysM peptidoglycan-binding domain-containing protein, partial [Burkholderiales bacterium]|nr:LysM peptidoglycan-binding domain-containing protein [Burkholderiales bacterium]